MPIWIPATTDSEPALTLSGWAVFLVLVPGIGTPTTHVAGYHERGREGRVSSPIEKVDDEKRCVVTSSGRVYRLYGRPGLGSEASYVWARWLSIWNVDVKEDLSQATLDGFEACSSGGQDD